MATFGHNCIRSGAARLPAALLLSLIGGFVACGASRARCDDAPPPAGDTAPPAGDKANRPRPKVRNLLPNLIRRAFGGDALPADDVPGEPATDDQAAGAAASSRKRAARDTSDPRAPTDAKTSSWLARAQALSQEGDWQQAVELLQKVTEQPEDSLYRTADGRWTSAKVHADRLRGQAPVEVLREYRQKFGGLARQILGEAQKSGDLRQFGRVAQRYFHTEAGYEAANHLATLHLDRGEFPSAARWFEELWSARAPPTRDPTWRVKAAFALARAGQSELAQTLVAREDSTPLLGGRKFNAALWLAEASKTEPTRPPVLAEWPMFYGNETHTGVADGGAALLLPRWRQPLTENVQVRTHIEQLGEDLSDQGTIPMPASFVTAVAGKVVFRTLHGAKVVDAQSGRALWSTAESQPIEQLLSAAGRRPAEMGAGPDFFQRQALFQPLNGMGWNASLAGFYGSAGEQSPLANLLFRNTSFGLTSSDLRRLFVVEDGSFLTPRQPGNPWQWDAATGGAIEAGNRLAAYDLETGNPLWTVGGAPQGEPFDPPLAGYYFFGPPVVAGDELYVVGEATWGDRSDQIRLLALDPRTGEERWSQLIAFAEAGIEKDVGRRWWTAQPAVSQGIVVCPTTVGWLAGIDRVTQGLVWGHRLPGPTVGRQPGGRGEQPQAVAMTPQTPLYGQWGAAPPIVAEGRIICSLPESQTLNCLDLSTGRELWSKPRGDGLYLAGVFQGQAVVVGRDGVVAYGLTDGSLRWKCQTSAPSGRGVAVRERFVLPLASGELWSIDLRDGRVAEKSFLPRSEIGLGNLLMYRGLLLSLDSSGLTAFEQRDAILAEIDRRLRTDPQDAEALLREAEFHASEQRPLEALRALHQVAVSRLTGGMRQRYRLLIVAALMETIQADPAHRDTVARLAELAAAVETPDETRRLRRLQAAVFIARAEHAQAFDALLELAADDAPEMLVRDDDPAISVRTAVWAAGRLAELLESLPAGARRRFDADIAARGATALAGSADAQRTFLATFGSHAAAIEVRFRLAAGLAERGEFLEAQRLLREIDSSGTRTEAALALERLAKLMLQFDLPSDAGRCYQRLERDFGSVVVRSSLTGARIVHDLRDAGRLPAASPIIADWQAGAIRLERLGAQHVNYVPQELSTNGSPAAYFQQHSCDIDHATQRLEISGVSENERPWSVPLRTQSSTTEGGMTFAQASGHQLTVLHRGVIHCLSPVERRVVWTRALDGRALPPVALGRNTAPLQPMQPSLTLASRLAAQQAAASGGPLVVANLRYVCQQDRRRLTVLDAGTGEIRWSFANLRPGTQVLGGTNVIYLRHPDSQSPVALRATDGKRLELPKLAEALSRAVCLAGDALVLPLAERSSSGLRLYDPVGDKDLWKVTFQAGALIGVLDPFRLAVLERDNQAGRFHLLDLESGRLQLLGELTPEELKGQTEIVALADGVNVYLLVNSRRDNQFYSEQVPFVRASGLVLAFDPEKGAVRWKRSITGQNLLLERLEASPLLLFASRRQEQRGRLTYWSLHLVGIDKLSGAKLLDEKSAAQPGFRSVTVNSAERYVELRSYNERVRLHLVEKAAVEGAAGD